MSHHVPPSYPPVADPRELLATDGEIIQLQHPRCQMTRWIALRVRPMGLSKVVLKNLSDREGGSLRILPTGIVDLKGGEGPWAQFVVEVHSDGRISLRNMGNEGKTNDRGSPHFYLGVDANGDIYGRCDNGEDGRWAVARVPNDVRPYLPALQARAVQAPIFMDDWDLSASQMRRFIDDGFVHVPNVVAPELIDKALVVINKALGTPGAITANEWGQPVLGHEYTAREEIVNLLYLSPAYTLAQRLLGKGRCNKPGGGQIALRFPEGRAQPKEVNGKSWHIDGLEKEHHSSFSLLLGITLSDCLEDFAGNFTVFPGSHHTNCEDMRAIVRSGQQPSSLVKNNKRSYPNGLQVKARRGDIVMAHHKLAHKGGDNTSPHIRYQIYFRLSHVDHEKHLSAVLEDVFFEFEGVKTFLAGGGAQAKVTDTASSAAVPRWTPSASASPMATPAASSQMGSPPPRPSGATLAWTSAPPMSAAPLSASDPTAALLGPMASLPPVSARPPTGPPPPPVPVGPGGILLTPELDKLVSMGFDPVRSDAALKATHGNVSAAIERLVAG